MELVELLHGGPEDNYRPYLHLRGELVQARPAVELPYGVDELVLRRGVGVPVDAFYDFTHKQLTTLVSKGYFSEHFAVPDDVTGIPWTLPGTADFLVVAPEFADQPPLVFMSVHDQTSLALDEASSGYDLAEYFPDVSQTISAEAEQASDLTPELTAAGNDMFHDVQFEQHLTPAPAAGMASEDERAAVPEGVFSRLVSEIEAKQSPTPAAVEEVEQEASGEPEIAPGSAWDVYLSRVAPGVERALSGEGHSDTGAATEAIVEDAHTEATEETSAATTDVSTPSGFIDFTVEEPDLELEPLSAQFSTHAEDEQRRVARQRDARIRAEVEAIAADDRSGDEQPTL